MTCTVETTMAASKLRNQQEYLLQGSITDDAVEHLLHRLRGLCDNSDSGCETFHDHEIVFLMRNTSGQSSSLRVRRSIEPKDKDLPWHIRYSGQHEVGDKTRATLVRSCVDVSCSSHNVIPFLQEMGFKVDFEYLSKGYIFQKGRMKVMVAKVSRTDPVEHVSNSYLVELSVVAPSGQDALADEVRSFAEQLKPLVTLDKVDLRRQQAS